MSGNLKNEVPTYVYSVEFCTPIKLGPGYWLIDERPILESADSWVAVRRHAAPGVDVQRRNPIVRLDRMELDLDGMTVANDQIFYATRERAQRFVDRWKETFL